jgi:hypothetical protein
MLIEFTDKILVFIASLQCSNNTLSKSFIPGALSEEEEEEKKKNKKKKKLLHVRH